MLPLHAPSSKTSEFSSFLVPYITELKSQSIYPPGNDIVIKTCYLAFLELIVQPAISRKITSIIFVRKFTPSHFANILFRAVQYIELYNMEDNQYPHAFNTVEKWKEELTIIFSKKFDILESLLLTKDTTTTIYQRYAGSKIILNALFPKKSLSVADLGCGGNYGLPGLIQNIEFEKIEDHTQNKIASQLLFKKTKISKAIAIDKEDPYKKDSKEWRLSCSFYPHEIGKMEEMILSDHLESETIFTRFDLTQTENNPLANNISTNFYDAVIMSTFLYQLSPVQIKTVLQFANKIVKKEGIIIIQDFAKINPANHKKIKLISNWFSVKNPYRTFIKGEITNGEFKEILRWNNGRCMKVTKGKDFEFILKTKM